MTAFSFYENSGYGAASRYTAICKSAPSAASSWKIAEGEVLAISNENTTPTAEGYIDYTLNEGIELAGGTTYYMVFLTSNTATDGSYTVGTQRVRLKNSSTYSPSVCLGNGAVRTDLIPGFKATLSTDALYSVNYTCKSTIDGSDITSGTFTDVMGTITAPTLDGYVFSHATTESGDAFDMTQLVSTDLNLYLYYAPLYNVTYNVYYGGNLKKSGQGQSAHGTTPAIPDELKDPYLTYTYNVDEITAATTEVNVTATWNGPFEISTDFDNAVWYYLQQQKSYGRYNYTNGSNQCKYTSSNEQTDNYQWAFIGDPFDGFYVINKGSGTGLYMKDAANIYMDATGTAWTIEEIDSKYFCLYNAAETIGDGKYINSRSAGMGKWYDNSAGSQLWVTLVPDDPFYDEAIALVEPFVNAAASHAGENFQLKASGAELEALVAAFTQIENNHNNSIKTTEDEYNNIASLLRNAVVYPETGYFRFKSAGLRSIGESYLSYGVDGYYYKTGLVTVAASQKATNLSTIFKLTKVADNQYTLSTQGMDVRTVGENNTPFPLGEGNAAIFSFIVNAPGTVAIFDNNNSDPQHACLHEAGWYAPMGVVRWESTSDCSQWTVESADVATLTLNEVDGKSYGTTYLPFDAYFLSGVKAYSVKVNGNNATYTEVANNEFPAGTGVLLISDEGNTSVSVYPTTSGVGTVTDNDLTGHYLAGNVSDALVLNKNSENVVGFYMLNSGSSLAANRAYLPTSALGTGVRALTLVQGTTGIDAALVNGNASQVYDLQGRRVMNAQKGLYIVNGKKTLVK